MELVAGYILPDNDFLIAVPFPHMPTTILLPVGKSYAHMHT